MNNPYIKLIEVMQKAGEQDIAPFRVGRVLNTSPLRISVGENVCEEEISGAAFGYAPAIGDKVLLANIGNTDNDYIIICKVVDN